MNLEKEVEVEGRFLHCHDDCRNYGMIKGHAFKLVEELCIYCWWSQAVVVEKGRHDLLVTVDNIRHSMYS